MTYRRFLLWDISVNRKKMPPLTSPVKANGVSLDARGVCRPCSVGPVRNPQFAIVRLRASTVSSAEPLTTRSPKSSHPELSNLNSPLTTCHERALRRVEGLTIPLQRNRVMTIVV